MAPWNAIALSLLLLSTSFLPVNGARIPETEQLSSAGSARTRDQPAAALEMLRIDVPLFCSSEEEDMITRGASPASAPAVALGRNWAWAFCLSLARAARALLLLHWAPNDTSKCKKFTADDCGTPVHCQTRNCTHGTAWYHLKRDKTCSDHLPRTKSCFSDFPSSKVMLCFINKGITKETC